MNRKKVFKILFYCFLTLAIAMVVAVFAVITYHSIGLPNHKNLKEYNPPITTRLYSNDGKFLKEYAKEKRLFVPIEQVPDLVKNAFLSAEDADFYYHPGVNIQAIISASIGNIITKITGKGSMRGGSTITQQVAKNFLLTNERTLDRKIKEAILSVRMTQAFSKNKILELYLNQIFLGNRAYGVASAALNYFNKSLDELTIEEAALLAALPKAPGKLDPTRNDQKDVLERRNWVIGRMEDLGYITKEQAEVAKNTPINLKEKNIEEVSDGEFFSEEVRKELVKMYGEDNLMEGGNVVRTTIDPNLQVLADEYLKQGIESYDIRHGYRGAIGNLAGEIDFKNNWGELINNFEVPLKYRKNWNKAVVLELDEKNNRAIVGIKKIDYDDSLKDELENNEFIKTSNDDKLLITGYIPFDNMKWARKYISADELGPEIKKMSDVGLKVGDVIVVEGNPNVKNEYFLKQIPEVNGAIVAMNPHTGKILAMMGGYIDSQMDFNRATQAERQPGSTIKPFAYLTALENGYTPASIIIDEEIELDQGQGRPPYKPKNVEGEGKFFGPTTLRVALERSRNVPTVRLASDVGIPKVAEMIRRFGISKRPKRIYSLVLGSVETNLMKMVRAYAMIVNGGKEIEPILIEKIQDKNGKTIYRSNSSPCDDCTVDEEIEFENIIVPEIQDDRKQIIDSATAFQLTNLLEGAVQRGTAWRAKAVGKPVGAKTGTTNDGKDAWFIGFSPDLVAGVYVGFDKPAYLGLNEMGSSVAGPIFASFMKNALKNKPSVPFRVPSDVRLVRIDATTGYYPAPGAEKKNIVLEAFKENDKIVKFENEVLEENVDEFMEEQESGFLNRPEIITNIQERPNRVDVDFDDENYDIEFENDEFDEE